MPVEMRPRLFVRRPDRRQHRNAGLHGAREDRAQAAAFRFGFAEPVEDQQLDIVLRRAVEQRDEFGKALRVEPAAFRLRTKVLRYPEALARGEVDQAHGRAAAVAARRVFLQRTTEPDVFGAQPISDAAEEFVDRKAGLVDNGREPRRPISSSHCSREQIPRPHSSQCARAVLP